MGRGDFSSTISLQTPGEAGDGKRRKTERETIRDGRRRGAAGHFPVVLDMQQQRMADGGLCTEARAIPADREHCSRPLGPHPFRPEERDS